MTSTSSAGNHPASVARILRSLPRVWDDLPLWAQLGITWKCNLACSYCTEYDNRRGHVAFEALAQRIDHCRELGCRHVDLIGGEPMLHPDLARLMRHVTDRSMSTGMTTNGFLLTRECLEGLIDAGLGRLQISVDAAQPRPGIPKSLKTLADKIELVSRYRLMFQVLVVVCDETIDQVEEVARRCFDHGVGVFFSVRHERSRLVPSAGSERVLERLRWLKAQKRRGNPVAIPYYVLDYYERALSGRPLDWTCHAGAKCFYVSPEGMFHFCAHVPAVRAFSMIRREDLAGFRTKKGCETMCGVDCVIRTSLPYSSGLRVLLTEARARLPFGRG